MTVIEVPAGIDSNKIVKNAYAKYDLSLGIGLAQVNGKVREDNRSRGGRREGPGGFRGCAHSAD